MSIVVYKYVIVLSNILTPFYQILILGLREEVK